MRGVTVATDRAAPKPLSVVDGVATLAGALIAGPVVLAAGLFGIATLRNRSRGRTQPGLADAGLLAQRLAVGVVILTALHHSHSRYLAGALTSLAVSVAGRSMDQRLRAARLARWRSGERTVLIGSADDVERTARLLARHPEHGLRPVATITPEGGNPTVLPGGNLEDLEPLMSEHRATHLLLTTPAIADSVETAIGRSRPTGVRLSVLPPLAELMTSGAEIVDVRGLPLLTLAPRRAVEGPAWWLKRVLDYAGSTFGLVLLSPFLLLVAAAIKLDSPGPVLFRQTRVGRDGRTFGMLKFRSMVVDAEARLAELEALNEASGPFFKMENDPRVTRVGRLLRRYCVDELPQLLNVLMGQMSLVGPRPCLTAELSAAPELFDWRLSLLPGMTGLWQLAGRSWLPVEEGLRMDLAYVEHWSAWLDLQLIVRTLVMAAGGTRRPSPVSLEADTPLDRSRYAALVENDDLMPRGASCDVSIVIVTHESAADIDRCLRSTELIGSNVTAEVIVVDNASTDGTADVVARNHPGVRLIRKRVRHGFSTNCNIGAIAASGRRILFLNPDARLTPGAVEELLDFVDQHSEVGAVGPQLVFPDGSMQASARRFPTVGATVVRRTPLRWVLRHSSVERRHLMLDETPDDGSSTAVDWILGAAFMMRSSTFFGMGGMDDGYRLYCEDIDLCRRLHDEGYQVALLPSAVVAHDLSELTRKRFLTRATIWHIRSMIRFLRIHGVNRPRPVTPQLAVRPLPLRPVGPVIDLREAAVEVA